MKIEHIFDEETGMPQIVMVWEEEDEKARREYYRKKQEEEEHGRVHRESSEQW